MNTVMQKTNGNGNGKIEIYGWKRKYKICIKKYIGIYRNVGIEIEILKSMKKIKKLITKN